jgi:hypothetical protein
MKTSINKRTTVLAACAFALATAVVAADTQAIKKIESYCAASWRNARIHPQEWQDCTQQALMEFLERRPPSDLEVAIDERESEARRELNRAVWRIVKRMKRQVTFVQFDEGLFFRLSEPEILEGWPAIEGLARTLLTVRQLQIFELLRDGWKVAEISQIMKVAPDRVSDEKFKAIAKLRERVALA